MLQNLSPVWLDALIQSFGLTVLQRVGTWVGLEREVIAQGAVVGNIHPNG